VFANTTSIECNFSILKWEMDENRTCLMHLSFEGVFQAKQRTLMETLWECTRQYKPYDIRHTLSFRPPLVTRVVYSQWVT
jgi:hypothetical protein